MNVKYADPYKEEKYGKLKGDKSESYFGVTFSEAVVHKTDEAYIIAGYATDYKSIVRSFNEAQGLTAGNCTIHIYGQEYEVRKKDKDGNWSSDNITPSIFELALYEMIKANEDDWMPHNAAIKVDLTHLPNDMLAGMEPAVAQSMIKGNVKFEQVDLTGKLPEYTPKTSYKKGKSYGGYKSVSPEEKLAFIKKQLEEDVKDKMYKQGQCLADLVDQFHKEHPDDENYIQIYFDILIACVK